MNGSRILRITIALALLGAVAATAQGFGGTLTPTERRAQLEPVYNQLMKDPQFKALQHALETSGRSASAVSAYLRYLPMSPVDLVEISMYKGRYEHLIPSFVLDWHDQWIRLHATKARALYGAAYVDAKMATPVIDTTASITGPTLPLTFAKMATVGTNRNPGATLAINPREYQGEIQVAVNPNNANQIVAAANTFDNAGGQCGPSNTQAIVFSADGGVTWGYTCSPDDSAYPGLTCNNTLFGSDPAVFWNTSGEVFIEYMLLCTADGQNIQYSIVVAGSTNGGATWTGRGIVTNSFATINQVEDKEFLAIDNNATSPFFGRMYSCWDRGNNERFARSTDGGATWTEVDIPAAPGGGFDLGCEIEVEDNGNVHVVWNTLTCGANCTNERMHHVRSTNGGLSFSTPVLVHDYNLAAFSGANCPDAQDQRCISSFGSVGIDNSGGACDGTLYATYTDFITGGVNSADVFVRRSTDGGNTWSAGVKVNDDNLANRAQFQPFLTVDQSNGTPVVAWFDARNDAGNDAVDYFVARSTDCGVSFEPNIQASQASGEFNNSTISFSNENSVDNAGFNANQYGEYLGLDARGGKAYVTWTDTRHFFPGSTANAQKENMAFAVVDFGAPGNTPPSVSISAPANGSSFVQGTSVTFTGSATDVEDGSLSASLAWSSSLDGAIGSGASFSTSALSVGTHTITASVTDSGGANGSAAISVTITSSTGGCTDCIDWNTTGTVSYSNQDVSSNVLVEDAGATLRLLDNTWRRTTQTFTLTANTVLEFDFRSDAQGEIHGIGFDEDDTLTNNTRIFELFGTQNWGTAFHDFDTYTTGNQGTFVTFQIPVGQFYTGSGFRLVLVNDNDAGSGNNSRFRNVRVFENAPPPPPPPPPPGTCTVDDDFQGGAAGWSNDAASTCSTGAYVLGTPTQQTSTVVTQVGGDHTTGTGNAIFTATNTSAGNADVDGGNCILSSPTWNVTNASTFSVWYFHGQRDTGDDASGDFFRLEISTDGGATFSSVVSIGDTRTVAGWTNATAQIPAGASVKLRLQVSDGAGPGDIIEGGIDDLSICDN